MVSLREIDALTGVGATHALTKPQGIDEQMWSLIQAHFQRLLDRYVELGNDEIAEILSACKAFIDAGGHDVRQFIRQRGMERSAIYGKNHWIAVLMLSLAEHQNLEAWVDGA